MNLSISVIRDDLLYKKLILFCFLERFFGLKSWKGIWGGDREGLKVEDFDTDAFQKAQNFEYFWFQKFLSDKQKNFKFARPNNLIQFEKYLNEKSSTKWSIYFTAFNMHE